MSLQTLYHQRAQTHNELIAVLNGPQTSEARAKSDRLLAAIETQTRQIEKINGEARATAPYAEETYRSSAEITAARRYRTAWADAMRNGEPGTKAAVRGGATAESIKLLRDIRARYDAGNQEQRDQLAGTQSITYTQGAVGGYFVPAGFVYDIDQALAYFAPFVSGDVFTIMETSTGNILPYPTSNDTEQAWHILGEASQIVDTASTAGNYTTPGVLPTQNAGNVGMGHVDFSAWKGSTGLIRVSLELIQDSSFALEPFLVERFSERLGRGYEAYLTNGTGASMPTGILPALTAQGAPIVTAIGSSQNDGISANTGANSIGYADLVNLVHATDPSYRRNAKFMIHDSTLALLKTRIDKFGRPIWVPAMSAGAPDLLCGYQYVINQSMSTIAASATTVVFGDLKKFVVRKVKDLQILRLDERFADFGEIAYIGFSRIDSNLVWSGGKAIATLQQHS